MNIVGILFFLVIALAVCLIVAGQLGLLAGKVPERLGATDGRLKPPSRTPNSVSSQAALYPDHPQKDYSAIAPLSFTGDGDAAMDQLAGVLQKTERCVVVKREPGYLYAHGTTALLKFTDDMEFWLDKPDNVIHVRSSSRLGQKDFGVNRARIEAIRAQFNA